MFYSLTAFVLWMVIVFVLGMAAFLLFLGIVLALVWASDRRVRAVVMGPDFTGPDHAIADQLYASLRALPGMKQVPAPTSEEFDVYFHDPRYPWLRSSETQLPCEIRLYQRSGWHDFREIEGRGLPDWVAPAAAPPARGARPRAHLEIRVSGLKPPPADVYFSPVLRTDAAKGSSVVELCGVPADTLDAHPLLRQRLEGLLSSSAPFRSSLGVYGRVTRMMVNNVPVEFSQTNAGVASWTTQVTDKTSAALVSDVISLLIELCDALPATAPPTD
jgi:hypothetical protein